MVPLFTRQNLWGGGGAVQLGLNAIHKGLKCGVALGILHQATQFGTKIVNDLLKAGILWHFERIVND